MTQEQIIEGNKLLDRFMYGEGTGLYNHYANHNQYHENWAWLFPVVDKIKNMNTDVSIQIVDMVTHIHIKPPVSGKVFYFSDEDPQRAVWQCVVAHAQWRETMAND
ncbi:MAG: hypothetical protein V4615_04965 [Bacteroidota bacterium]